MNIRAIPTPTAHSDLQPKRRVWPPRALQEDADAKRSTPRHWQQPRQRFASQLAWSFVLLVFVLIGRPLHAQTPDDVTTGTLWFESPAGVVEAPRVHTSVAMHVSGLIARVEVRQEFHNASDGWVEGLYAFPLPDNSAVNELRMEVGDRVIVGEVREKFEAQRVFEQARDSGRRASVVHQQRPNVFRTAVANIGPGETIVIAIAYLQVLDQEAGRYSLRFPLTMTPRYVPGITRPSVDAGDAETPVRLLSASHDSHDSAALADLQPPLVRADVARQRVALEVILDAGTAIENIASASHPVDVAESSGTYRVKLADGFVPADRDFQLAWSPVVLGAPAATLFREQTAAGEHVLLMFLPPQEKVASAAPREVIFIIDTSGSMQGESMEQARAALLKGLSTLSAADRFNVVQFNSIVHSLFDEPVDASAQNVQRAERYVNSLRANGGTEMLPALGAAFSMPTSSEHLRQIVFMTDGAVSNEVELMRAIDEGIGHGRLFVVGIGSAPNAYFMRAAAQTGRGTFTFIGATQEVEQKMTALFLKLTQPVLSDIELHWPSDVTPEYAPTRIADLYADEPLVISARLPERTRGVLTITGRAGSAWTRQISLDAVVTKPGIATLWARNRIADLMNLQTKRVDDAQIRAYVLPLALEYQLVSKYTSLVAVDKTPARSAAENLRTARTANTLPHGSNATAGLPQTASPAQLQMILGALALFAAAAMWLIGRIKRAKP